MVKHFILLFLFSIPAFSQECKELQKNLSFLASDRLLGRVPESPEHREARDYIFKKLSALGAVTFTHEFPGGTNLWGVLYPPNNRSGSPLVLISSHYDHLAQCPPKSGSNSSICNGAADNAAGVSALINILAKLKSKITAPIAFAIFDKEEDGLVGSSFFAKSNLLPSIRLVLNLDIIGLNIFPGMENTHLVMGAETGGEKLINDLNLAASQSGLNTFNFTYSLAHQRGDLTNFVQKGIPSIHFTDGDGSVYHSQADEYQYLNQKKIIKICTLISKVALLAEKNGPYPFVSPFQDGRALPNMEDVRTGRKLVFEIQKNTGTQEIFTLLKKLDLIIKKEKFSLKEMSIFQQISLDLMEYSRELEDIVPGNKCEN